MSLDRLNEAFKLLDALNEDMFDTSLDGINSLADTMDGDNADEIIKIIDVDAETEEDVQDSYLGKVILNCNVCHSLRFADKEDIDIDDSGVVNAEEACPYCGESEGFTIVGQIDEFEDGESGDEPAEDEDDKVDDDASDIEPKADEEPDTSKEKNESVRRTRRGFTRALNESGKSVDFSKIKKLGRKLKEDADVTDQIEIDTKEAGFITKKKDLEKQGYKVLHTGDGKITMAKPKELTESPYYLDTKYDSRKSFYNKAMVSDNTDELYSYGVKVMEIRDGKPVITCREDQLSQTTLRHIKEFLKQKGFPAVSKQQIIKDYLIECSSSLREYYDEEAPFGRDRQYSPYSRSDFSSNDPVPQWWLDSGKSASQWSNRDKSGSGYDEETGREKSYRYGRYGESLITNRELEEDYRDSKYRDVVLDHFDFTTSSDEFLTLMCDLVERVDDFSDEEEIWEAIDSGMIYTRDQWTAYMHYCDMGESTDKMYEGLFGDLFAICDRIANKQPTEINESIKSYMKSKLTKRFVEGFNNINVETDDQKLTMTQDEAGKVTVTTEPIDSLSSGDDLGVDATATEGDETITPVSDDLANEIMGANEETDEEPTGDSTEDTSTGESAEEPTESDSEEPTDDASSDTEQPDDGESAEESDEDADFEESYNHPNGRAMNEFYGSKKADNSFKNKMSAFSGNTINLNFSGNTASNTTRDKITKTDSKVDAKVAEVGATVKADAKVKADARVAADVGADGASVGVAGGMGGGTNVKKPSDKDDKPIDKAMEKTMGEDLGDWYRKTFDKPASVRTQQGWEDRLADIDSELSFGDVSDRKRARLKREGDNLKNKFNRQRDYERRHGVNGYERTPVNKEVDLDIKDFDEVSFSALGEKYLKNVYENVESFKATNVANNDTTLIVEGVISFNSGKQKKTGFIFEADSATKDGAVRFVGGNKHFSESKKAFTLNGKLQNNKLFTESFAYNYRPRNSKNRVVGKIQSK